MDPRNRTLIPLIIIFFIFGVIVGYVAHKPETIEKPVFINKTIEVPKIIEKIVEVTPIPAPMAPTSAPTATPEISDFTVKSYNPFTDIPSYTIGLTNRRAYPDTLSIRPNDSVLIKITDYTLQSPLTFILNSLNSSYTKNLGKSGAAYIAFNRKGTYTFRAIITTQDPNEAPQEYAKGTIIVY